tara:strand:- start:1004 stop:1789 length:786 start_codon:yes stop_codon:yes gene_type:complete
MVQKNILVSILIDNYNNSQHIKQCIESLNSQSYKNLEIIFFDDNSSDNSLDIIKQFTKVKIIENKIQTKFGSLNQINAFKEAIKISKGELIFLLDSDDYFDKEKIEKIVDYFENNKKAKIVFDYPLIVKDNNVFLYKKKIRIFKTYWSYIHPTSCISIRKDCFDELLKTVSYKEFTDIWIDLRICLFSKYILKDFKIINENLTFYRESLSNVSSRFNKFSKNWWKRRMQAHQFLQKFSKDNGLDFNKNFDFLLTKIICKFL